MDQFASRQLLEVIDYRFLDSEPRAGTADSRPEGLRLDFDDVEQVGAAIE